MQKLHYPLMNIVPNPLMNIELRWVILTQYCESCHYRHGENDFIVTSYNPDEVRKLNRRRHSPLDTLIEEHGTGQYTHCALPICTKPK